MDLNFDLKLAEGYKSNSQIARVLTENWLKKIHIVQTVVN